MELNKIYSKKKEALKAAIHDFEQTLAINLTDMDDRLKDAVENGQIQKFEIVTELLWKSVKQYLFIEHAIDAKSPKQSVKELFLTGGLNDNDYNSLLDMLDDRNRLSHIYQKVIFEEIKAKLTTYLALSKRVLSAIG